MKVYKYEANRDIKFTGLQKSGSYNLHLARVGPHKKKICTCVN